MKQRVICDEKIISGKYKNNQTVNEYEDVQVQVRLYIKSFYHNFHFNYYLFITIFMNIYVKRHIMHAVYLL